MALTTALAFQLTSPFAGCQPIHETSTTKKHPLGTLVRAVDPIYGEGAFIYALGVASTAQGNLCTFNNGVVPASVRTVTTTVGPCGVAMSANVALQYGWYQVQGAGVITSSGATIENVCGTTATPGVVDDSGSAIRVEGTRFVTAQDAPGSGFTGVQLNFPSCSLDG